MQKHTENMKTSLSCPFPIAYDCIKWEMAEKVLSVDDSERTIIVDVESNRYLVEIPKILFDAIYKSGELNVMDSDLGFDEMF
jgi:hypothetical protein